LMITVTWLEGCCCVIGQLRFSLLPQRSGWQGGSSSECLATNEPVAC
jgi:hypothetical protein